MPIRTGAIRIVAALIALTACQQAREDSLPLEVIPATSEIEPGATISFHALASGQAASDVIWSVAEQGGGTIDQSGIYTAPDVEGTYSVVATLAGGSQLQASAVVRVKRGAGSVKVEPSMATLAAGASMTFSATITGSADGGVTWSVQEGSAGGTITSAGVYTAPSTAGTYHVVATSVVNPARSGTATVTVTAEPPPPPTGTQLFVSTTGNDSNPGTEALPWRTIQKAMSSATAGSTVNIRAGTYSERLSVNVSGAAGAYVTFQPYGFSVPAGGCGGHTGVQCGGDQVVIDLARFGNPVTDGVPYLAVNGRSYVRVQGLTFQNYTTTGAMQRGVRIYNGASYVEINRNRFVNIKNTGTFDHNAILHFWVEGSGTHDVTIRGNEFGNLVLARGETLTLVARNVVVEGNWLHDTDHIGINVGSTAPNAVGIVVSGNLLEWIGRRRDGTLWNNKNCNALYVNGAHNVVIERNTVRYSGYPYAVVTEPSFPDSYDIIIRNNIAYDTYAGAMIGNWYSSTDGSSVYNVKVLNNTLVNTSQGLVIRPYTSGSIVWKNNIVVSPRPIVNSLGWPIGTIDYNLYDGGTAGPDAHKVIADPRFMNVAAADFTLQATSPAIDMGDPNTSVTDSGSLDFAGGPRIVNGRIEIGAHEAD